MGGAKEMKDKASYILKMESKELVEELECINEKDKDIILASLKGMLIAASVNEEIRQRGKTA